MTGLQRSFASKKDYLPDLTSFGSNIGLMVLPPGGVGQDILDTQEDGNMALFVMLGKKCTEFRLAQFTMVVLLDSLHLAQPTN